MNKCAKFHKDSPSGKKVKIKINLPSAIEFSETAHFVYNFVRNLMQASNIGSAFDQLFLWICSWNFHTRCLLTLSNNGEKVKNNQKLKSRGPALMQFGQNNKRCVIRWRRQGKDNLRMLMAMFQVWCVDLHSLLFHIAVEILPFSGLLIVNC